MKRLLKRGLGYDVSGLSIHFMERLNQRRLKLSDVKESLRNPNLSFQNGGALVFVGPKLTVVMGENGKLITAYKNRESVYKGSKKKDIRNRRKRTDDRQDKRVSRIGFGFDGEES